MVSSQLEILSKQLVKPSHLTPQSLRHLKLSFLDQLQILGGVYIPLIFFYENDQFSSKIDPSQRSLRLRQSLSETLTKFYPFAGRINGNASVHCDDSGALYVEASVHAQLSDAFQNATTEDLPQYLPELTCANTLNNDTSNQVLLAVQISFFECGGMAVGILLSHVVADAHSLFTFMNIWAQNCCSTAEIFMEPNFDMGFNHFPPVVIPADLFGDPKEHQPPPAEEKIVMKRFVFDNRILSAMKQQVSSCSTSHSPSRVETVSALIWKNLIEIARAKSHGAKRASVAFHAVNMRPKITPSLPEFSIGNISALTAAALSESENTTDYFNLVSPLRRALRNVGSDYIGNEQRRMEHLRLLCQQEPDKDYNVFSSWCRFPYYEVDYGWGKPLSVCTTAQPYKNTVIFMDTRSGDGIQAWITLAEDEMAMLPHDFLALESNDFRK